MNRGGQGAWDSVRNLVGEGLTMRLPSGVLDGEGNKKDLLGCR